MIGSCGSRLDPPIPQVCHLIMQALITDRLISIHWGVIYSEHIGYELPQDKEYESDHITFRKYLVHITVKTGKYCGDQLFHTISCGKDRTTINFMYFFIIMWKQLRLSMDDYEFLLKSYLSTLTISLLNQGYIELLLEYGIRTSATSPTQMICIMRKRWKVFSRVQVSRHLI